MKRTNISTKLLLPLTGAALLSCNPASAQIFFSSGSPYTQNFDSLVNTGTANTWTDNSTLTGWYASKTSGGATVSTYRADTGAGNTGALYSFGTAGSTERALGSIGSGTPGNFAYGVRFQNDTTLAITNILVTYTGEQWRNGGNTATQALAFSYQIGNQPITSSDAAGTAWTPFAPLSFLTPTVGATAAALDGNAAANRIVLSVLMTNVVVYPGQEFFLRWLDINDSGNDHGVAVDDLSVSFTTMVPDLQVPSITVQPQSTTNNASTVATFSVAATGGALTYQWQKDGSPLSDGFKYTGTATPTLTVSNILGADAGLYSVVVANPMGNKTSDSALLTVIDPAILTQPQSRTNVAGDTANFYVRAAGTYLVYQWQFKGADISGATTSSLNVYNVQSASQGAYSVVVSNDAVGGNVLTSAVAQLTLLSTPSTRLAQWDFNATNTLSMTSPSPSMGSGGAGLLGSCAGAFASGSFSDPAGLPGMDNSGWLLNTFATQGTSNKLTGAQFNVSTLGYQDILLTWEERHSDTASKYLRVQYSTDGSTFNDGPLVVVGGSGNYGFYSANLAGFPELNNSPNFAFRLVSEYESTAIGTANENYVGTAGGYSTGGTVRFDLMSVYGNTFSGVSRIPLTIRQYGNDVVLTWSNPAFSLQSSVSSAGGFTTVSGATSPYTNSLPGTVRFFRLVYP